uniref:F-box domain-containing protein n=1 Tax=Rhabditophanes sp. KR3021 TaxID=114890 RepID=A0AC35U660_9BILA
MIRVNINAPFNQAYYSQPCQVPQAIKMLDLLPVELMVKISSYLCPIDVKHLRMADKKRNQLILFNYHYLPRFEVALTINRRNDEYIITFTSIKQTENVIYTKRHLLRQNKDFLRLLKVLQINSLVLTNLDGQNSVEDSDCLVYIFQQFVRLRHAHIIAFKIDNVHLSVNNRDWFHLGLTYLLSEQTKSISVKNCTLLDTLTVNDLMAMQHLNTIAWIDTSSGETEIDMLGNQTMERMSHILRYGNPCHHLPFYVEVEAISVFYLIQYLDNWFSISNPNMFSITIGQANEDWKYLLLEECINRQYSTFNMEIPSKACKTAHVKIIFQNNTCKIWSVLDVPAQIENQRVNHARYYRDF